MTTLFYDPELLRKTHFLSATLCSISETNSGLHPLPLRRYHAAIHNYTRNSTTSYLQGEVFRYHQVDIQR